MLGPLNLISVFSVNRHAPENSTGFIFIFCYCLWSMLQHGPLVRQIDVVIFADIPVDVGGDLIVSMYVHGRC